MSTKHLLGLAALAIGMLAPAGTAVASPTGLSGARAATADFHRLAVAEDAGYGLFTDAAAIACIDNPGVGAMGIHYANGAIFGDPGVNAATPEALVYEPEPNGRLRLVALEYIVLQSAWHDAGNSSPPALFGREFEPIAAGNRYGLPAFYELHAWVWKHNPRGMFDDWNPRVSCADGPSSHLNQGGRS